ncbi:tripartite motif-containing protein 40 isoform X2 [Pteropus vampyrus]|uniref:E3 ubiquitin ligase TRIM40 n=1 Tax=Pteropus vampyrus TaxID=132908 RepID=A0A6P6C184_PTEVA|nr:tripartite motif-containing protein 40 isoform X2 [Pteropus vampyrus]
MVSLRENNREEGICPICQEHLKEAVSTDCGHFFCRVCLAQHVEKASVFGVFYCPLCRKPCSEGVLGAAYICHSHQKKVCWFCEESRLLLCIECLVSPEHKFHCELAIEDAISHYKERLNRRSRKLRKDLGELRRLRAQEEEKLQAMQFQVACGPHRLEAKMENQLQTENQPDALPQQWPDQLKGMPAEVSGIFDISRTITQLSSLVTDLERTAKKLDANMLKNASDLLTSTLDEILIRESNSAPSNPWLLSFKSFLPAKLRLMNRTSQTTSQPGPHNSVPSPFEVAPGWFTPHRGPVGR